MGRLLILSLAVLATADAAAIEPARGHDATIGVEVSYVDIDAFHEAFGTEPGDGMWLPPEERVRIW